jgi:hypothetical protein
LNITRILGETVIDETHHVLIHADDVNLVAANKNITNETHTSFIGFYNKGGPQAIAKKTK